MRLLQIEIYGFRGIKEAKINFEDHTVLIGQTGTGKSTIIDAIALVLGRSRLVRSLTEHDFFGSNPSPADRIRIVATIGDFSNNSPEHHVNWFRPGRGIPKWWNPASKVILCGQENNNDLLCVQLGIAARFDHDELSVETVRYFHDDCDLSDPFNEDVIIHIPARLFNELGFFILPTFRTWEKSISFGSELFRRVISNISGFPSNQILMERNKLREPERPLEKEKELSDIVERINLHLAQLIPDAPRFQLRLTATDSESFLQALVPHYESKSSASLPVGRHGTGLLSLQTLILLLEIGHDRRSKKENFIFALEEPELHLPPSLQRRLIYRAQSYSTQTICTSHSPRVAGFYPATKVIVLENKNGVLRSPSLLADQLCQDTSNAIRKLFWDLRPKVVDALMYPYLLIPEGRIDYEFLRLLTESTESTEGFDLCEMENSISFGSLVGVIPTHDSAIKITFNTLKQVRHDLAVLVDGDPAGDNYIKEILACQPPPIIIFQWPPNWEIEDVIIWILEANPEIALQEINLKLELSMTSLDELVIRLKSNKRDDKLKGNYLAYEEIVSVIGGINETLIRTIKLLNAFAQACLGKADQTKMFEVSNNSTDKCKVLRFKL
jgi:hypothetical protein